MNDLATRPTRTADILVLPDSTRDLVEASVSPNTRRAYAGVWRRFDEFQRNRLGRLEADDAGVAAYLTGLFESGRSPATASITVAALRFRARHAGQPDPVGPLSERGAGGVPAQRRRPQPWPGDRRRLGSERRRCSAHRRRLGRPPASLWGIGGVLGVNRRSHPQLAIHRNVTDVPRV